MPRPTDAEKDHFLITMLGGKECCRITIPLINVTQMRELYRTLEQLARHLREIDAVEGLSNRSKVINARNAITWAHQHLKGGSDYKGTK